VLRRLAKIGMLGGEGKGRVRVPKMVQEKCAFNFSLHVYLDRHDLSVSVHVFLGCGERLRGKRVYLSLDTHGLAFQPRNWPTEIEKNTAHPKISHHKSKLLHLK